jgi:hypothetical protein
VGSRIRLLQGEVNREYVLPYELEAVYLAACPSPLDDFALLLLDCSLRDSEARLLDWQEARLTPAHGARYGYETVRSANSKNSKPTRSDTPAGLGWTRREPTLSL